MRVSNLLPFIAIVATTFFSPQARALNSVSITCAADGQLVNFMRDGKSYNPLLPSQIKSVQQQHKAKGEAEKLLRQMQGLPATAPAKSELIELTYTLTGPNSNRSASDYMRSEIESMVEAAMAEGVDPYLVLAVSVMENPPLKSRLSAYMERRSQRGSPPVDGSTLAHNLQCHTQEKPEKVIYPKSKSGHSWHESQVAVYLKPTGVANLPGLQGKGQPYYLCSRSNAIPHGAPLLFEKFKSPQGYCCLELRTNEDLTPSDEKNAIADHFGSMVLKSKVVNRISTDKNLSLSIQYYNGIGCIGCTEKFKNDCLHGMHMKDRPIYGAQTADLMLNMFMNNPEINEIVLATQRRLRVPVVSSFCLEKGAGTHRIDKNRFWDEQYKFLMGGTDGNYRTRLGNGIFEATTPELKKRYNEIELKRRFACGPLFLKKQSPGSNSNSGSSPSTQPARKNSTTQ